MIASLKYRNSWNATKSPPIDLQKFLPSFQVKTSLCKYKHNVLCCVKGAEHSENYFWNVKQFFKKIIDIKKIVTNHVLLFFYEIILVNISLHYTYLLTYFEFN